MTVVATHEDYSRRNEAKRSSNRSFGLVFAAVFAIVTLLPILRGHAPRRWAAPVSILFLIAALACPAILGPLNKIWTRFGLLLNKITSPILLGVLFFLVITPLGLLIRALGKSHFKAPADPALPSYWTRRDPPGPAPDTMTNQF